MTAKLDSDSRNALINYRIQRAYETLQEADYNAVGKYYNTAVNRLYYSVFYAANALLLSKEIVCGTHKGIKNILSLHFIKTGLLDVCHGKSFNQLFINRQSGDYEDFIFCDLELFNSLRPKAEEFIKAVEKLLKEGN